MRRYAQYAKSLTDSNGNTYLSTLAFADFNYQGSYVMHRVNEREAGRLDIIAYAYLKDASAWYLIAKINQKEGRIRDPIADVVTGLVIKIPVSSINQLKDIVGLTYAES